MTTYSMHILHMHFVGSYIVRKLKWLMINVPASAEVRSSNVFELANSCL